MSLVGYLLMKKIIMNLKNYDKNWAIYSEL